MERHPGHEIEDVGTVTHWFQSKSLGMDSDYDFAVWSIPRCGSLVLQLVRSVIPVKLGNRASSVFVGVCVSIVCKEGKVSIRSGIDAQRSDALGIRGA